MKKGFTLIELLGVIVILGILVLVAFPPLLNQIKKSKNEINNATELLIIDAAKDYVEDNKNNYEFTEEGLIYCIDVSTLVDNNYLNEKIKNENLGDMDTTKKIKLTYNNDKFKYEISDNCIDHSIRKNNVEISIETENSGLYKSEFDPNRYIYIGSNPINNWIELNEGTKKTPNYVKYRIVSFEPDGTIKVVREETIGTKVWDAGNARKSDGTNNTFCTSSGGCGVWGSQSTTLYNGETLGDNFHYIYYKKTTDTSLTHGRAGKVSDESTINKFLNDGSWDPLSSLDVYIDNHEFNVGGIYYVSTLDKPLIKEKEEEAQLKWIGKIGLLNITDYVETSLNPNCTNVHSNNATNGTPCKELNWIYKNYEQWSISPSISISVWDITSSGNFRYNSAASNSENIRPAFYLKSSTKLTGQGTEENPYKIQ